LAGEEVKEADMWWMMMNHNEAWNQWLYQFVAPMVVPTMYNEEEIEKRIKYAKGEKDETH